MTGRIGAWSADLRTAVCSMWVGEPQWATWARVGGSALLVLLSAGLAASGCVEAKTSATAAQAAALGAARGATISLRAGEPAEQGRLFVRGPWGRGPGAFGKRDEASRPGPMALTATAAGELVVLDQVNRRALRFDAAGRRTGSVEGLAETTEDIVVAGPQLFALVYERGAAPGYRLERHALDGGGLAPLRTALDRSIQLATGLFVSGAATAPSVWVEQRHDATTRIVAGGAPLPTAEQREVVLGRPVGGQRLSALREHPHQARVLRVTPKVGVEAALTLRSERPIIGLHALAADAAGRIYLGLLLGDDGRPARRLLVCVEGTRRRLLELPSDRATDTFRPLTVAPDGAVFYLASDEAGVRVLRFAPMRRAAGGDA